MDILKEQKCTMCNSDTLTLTEDEREIPYFGKVYLFAMSCSTCKYRMSDVEAEQAHDPVKVTVNIETQDDMSIRVVKSSQATIKIPQLKMSVEPQNGSIGYISNIEGLICRFESIIENQKDDEDPDVRKKVKVLLKKLWKVKLGEFPLKIIIEDPSGNSAIISEKATLEKLKVKK